MRSVIKMKPTRSSIQRYMYVYTNMRETVCRAADKYHSQNIKIERSINDALCYGTFAKYAISL